MQNPYKVLSRAKVIVIESYDQQHAFQTPMLFVEHEERYYVRALSGSEKVQRMMNNADVRVSASDYSGQPKSDWFKAVAVVHDEKEMKWVANIMRKEFGLGCSMVLFREWIKRGFRSQKCVVVEIQIV